MHHAQIAVPRGANNAIIISSCSTRSKTYQALPASNTFSQTLVITVFTDSWPSCRLVVLPWVISEVRHLRFLATYFVCWAFSLLPISQYVSVSFLLFSGKGLPFFTTTIPGIVKTDENKKTTGLIAKNSFFVHKQLGVYGKCLLSFSTRMHFMIRFSSLAWFQFCRSKGKYLIPIHAGAAVTHVARGHSIFARINPFARA